MIPAQRYPDGGEPVTEPFVLDLAGLIPIQRCAPSDAPVTVQNTAQNTPQITPQRPDPVLVQQMAARPGRTPIVARLTAVVLGTTLVAVLLLVLLLL